MTGLLAAGFVAECQGSSSMSYFWYRQMLDITADISDSGTVQWRLLICLVICWAVVYLCIIRGIETTGKVRAASSGSKAPSPCCQCWLGMGEQAHSGPHGQLLILVTVSALNRTLCQGSHAGSLLAATVTSPCPSISVDSASHSHCSTGSGLRSPHSEPAPPWRLRFASAS